MSDGYTLLHVFTSWGCSDIELLRLLEAGIPASTKDNYDCTALDLAVESGNLSLCQLLVAQDGFEEENRFCDDSLLKLAIDSKKVDMFTFLLGFYEKDSFNWDITMFRTLLEEMPDGVEEYLNKFITVDDPEDISRDMDIQDLCAIYGDAKDCTTNSALPVAVELVAKKNVLAHPVLRHIINLKWKKMGFGFYCEVVAYLGLLISYFVTITLGGQDWVPLSNGTEIAVMVLRGFAWLCCFYLLVKVEYGELHGQQWAYFKSFWNWINFIAYSSILVTIPIEVTGKSTSPGHHALLAVINVLLWLNMLQYICINRTIGVLVNTMERMVQDVGQFLVLYSIFLLGFSSALHSIMYEDDGYTTYGDTFITVLLMLFGNLTYDPFGSATGWKWVICNTLLLSYMIIVVIMLLNVLIAMMSKSIDAIKEEAEEKFWLNNAESILRIEKSLDENVLKKICAEIKDGIQKEEEEEAKEAKEEAEEKAEEAKEQAKLKSKSDYQPLLTSPNPNVDMGPEGDIEQGISGKYSEIRSTDAATPAQEGAVRDEKSRGKTRSNKYGDVSSETMQIVAIEKIAKQITELKTQLEKQNRTLEEQMLALKATIVKTQEEHQSAILEVITKVNNLEVDSASRK